MKRSEQNEREKTQNIRLPGWKPLFTHITWFVSLCLVLPMTTLPIAWQHQTIIIIIGILTVLNLLTEFRKEYSSRAIIRFFTIWSIYMIALLLVSSSGLLESDFFFLLYALMLIVSFALNPMASWMVITAILVVLYCKEAVWSDIFWTAPTLVSKLTKFGSLLAFAPLTILFGQKYNNAQSDNEQYLLTQQLLQTYQEEDEGLINMISAGVCIVSAQLRIVEISRPACQMLHYQADEVLDQPISEVFSFYDAKTGETELGEGLLLKAIYKQQATADLVCRLKSTDADQKLIVLNIMPIKGRADHSVGAMLVFEYKELRKDFEHHSEQS